MLVNVNTVLRNREVSKTDLVRKTANICPFPLKMLEINLKKKSTKNIPVLGTNTQDPLILQSDLLINRPRGLLA